MVGTLRLPGVIVVSRATGKVTDIVCEEIPVEKARPVIQGLAKIGRRMKENEDSHNETMGRAC